MLHLVIHSLEQHGPGKPTEGISGRSEKTATNKEAPFGSDDEDDYDEYDDDYDDYEGYDDEYGNYEDEYGEYDEYSDYYDDQAELDDE